MQSEYSIIFSKKISSTIIDCMIEDFWSNRIDKFIEMRDRKTNPEIGLIKTKMDTKILTQKVSNKKKLINKRDYFRKESSKCFKEKMMSELEVEVP